MDCIRAQQLVKPYLEGCLSDRELEEFLDHTQDCPRCFDELEIYYSIYRTLNNVDEKGDYNFPEKLRRKMESSRKYLQRRSRIRTFKTAVIAAAQICVLISMWGMFLQSDIM